MKSVLLLLLLFIGLSCQKDVNPDSRIYGKWVLTGGSALQKRQSTVKNEPFYLDFATDGHVTSNLTSNCYWFRLGEPGELMAINNCIDCIGKDCNVSIWRYTFPAPYEMTLEFGPGDVGYFRR